MEKEVQGIRYPVEGFCARIRQQVDLGIHNSGVVCSAFCELLHACARRRRWSLIADRDAECSTIPSDWRSGIILDGFHLTRGVWRFEEHSIPGNGFERQDSPAENLLLQTPVCAVVCQRSRAVLETRLDSAKGVLAAMDAFFSYRSITMTEWERAVTELERRLPALTTALLQSLRKERLTNKRFSRVIEKLIVLAQKYLHAGAAESELEKWITRELLVEWLRIAVLSEEAPERDAPSAALRGLIIAAHAIPCRTIRLLDELRPFLRALENVAQTVDDPMRKEQFLATLRKRWVERFPLNTAVPDFRSASKVMAARSATRVKARPLAPAIPQSVYAQWLPLAADQSCDCSQRVRAVFAVHTSGIKANRARLSFHSAPGKCSADGNGASHGRVSAANPEPRRFLYRPFVSLFARVLPEPHAAGAAFMQIFPHQIAESENRMIAVSRADHKPFSCLMTDRPVDWNVTGGFGSGSFCFPFYVYGDGDERIENVTDFALEQFRAYYGEGRISKQDIFDYVYGILHHSDYRNRWARNLRRDLPRIPFDPAFDFYAASGRKLGQLHAKFEEQPEHALHLIETARAENNWRLQAMEVSRDRTALFYNDSITIAGVPALAFAYRLGNRSALDWLVDQYRIRRDQQPEAIRDPNREEDPDYIIRLVGRVVGVSVETLKITASYPPLASMCLARRQTSAW